MVDETMYTEEVTEFDKEFDEAVKSIKSNDDGTVEPPQIDPPKNLTFG